MNQPVRPPLGSPIVEAEHFLKIYFPAGSEGSRYARIAVDELATLRRRLAEVTAERDALRYGAEDVPARVRLAARLEDAAASAQEAGAVQTALTLGRLAYWLPHLPTDLAEALARRVLHGERLTTDTEQETA